MAIYCNLTQPNQTKTIGFDTIEINLVYINSSFSEERGKNLLLLIESKGMDEERKRWGFGPLRAPYDALHLTIGFCPERAKFSRFLEKFKVEKEVVNVEEVEEVVEVMDVEVVGVEVEEVEVM